MDDLDLERLKQELDDVSGGSRYDVDDIMREEGAFEPEPDRESLEQLMQRFGIHVEQSGADAAPAGGQPKPSQTEEYAALLRASEQMQDVIDQQNELAEQARGETPQPDPLEEQEDVFARLFNQLGEIEQSPVDAVFAAPQTDMTDPRTELLEEPEEEPDLMARLFADAPVPVQPSRAQDDAQATVRWDALYDADATQVMPPVKIEDEAEQPDELPDGAETQLIPPVETDGEPETVDEVPDEAADDTLEEPAPETPRKGFWTKWFGADDGEAEESEDTAGDEPSDADAAQGMPPVETDGEPEMPDSAPDEAADDTLEEPAPETPRKGFWTKWFGADDGEAEESAAPPADELPDGDETQLIPPVETDDEPETAEEETGDAPQEIYYEPEVEERLPEPPQDDAGEADEPSAGVAEPAPRPEDIPVISEEELEEFLSGVEEEPEEPIASFEQLLQDNGMQAEPPVPGQPNRLPEEFPEEETTVYLNLPVNKPGAPQAQEPELFDAEADLEAEAQQEKEEKHKNLAKEPDPAWFRQTLEELSQTAPALEELRREGPVMQREVARQREWILERHRAYMQAQHPAPPQEQPPEPEEPEEDSEPDAIEAAEELRAMLEQDRREDDAVFNDRPDGKPEAEPDGREQSIDAPQADRQPDNAPADDRSGEQPEQAAPQAAQPETPAAPRKAKRPHRARREEEIPRDLHKAANLWKRRARGQAQRSMIVAVLTAVALYLSCAADFALPLPASMDYVNRPDGVLTALLVLQLAAMAAAFDVVRDGVRALMQRSPDLSTLVDLALVLNLAHCAALLVREGEELPYAGVAMLALFARMRAQVSDARTRHYVYKVAAGTGAPAGVFCRADGTIVKAPLDGAEPFVRQIVKPDRGRQAEAIVTALAAVLSLVLSVLVCVTTGDAGRIAYVLAATMTGACQLALLSAIPMGRCNAARHLMKSGAALDGVRGASALAAAGTVVVTDDDLFPAGSVALERLELRSQLNDATALAYAAALAGESSLGHMLAEEVRARYGAPLTAHHVVRYTGGGLSGRIGGLEILLGGADFMAERGIPVSDVPESGLVLAVEHEVAAVLVVDYQVPAVLFNAMQVLTERRTRILLHTRNHQVTPELVERLYGLREGTVQLPELEADRALRNPRYAAEGALCAMLLRDSLVPFADTISTAQAQSRLTRAGALIGVGAALLCMLLMAYLCFVFVPEDARPIRMLLYMILCFVPIFFLESGVGRD